MERGVLVGGLMVFGSFLLATLLNRSAMEEMPPAPPPPVTLVAPLNPPAAEAGLAPTASGCAAADAQLSSNAPLTPTEQVAPDCPGRAD